MTYVSDVPVSGDSLGGTRDRIRVNFGLISSVMAVNHVAFNTSGSGKHKFLQMPEQPGSIGQVGAPTPPTTSANEAGLYAKVGTNPAEANLVFRGESDGFEYQLTRAYSSSTSSFANTSGTGNSGWTFLPGGLILAYGSKASPGESGSVTFPVVFASAPYNIQLTLYRSGDPRYASVNTATPISTTGFNYLTNASGSGTTLLWTAIGK